MMIKWIAIGILVILVLVGGVWAWRYFTAPIEGRIGARQQIQSKEMMIAAYNHFFDLYASIKSYDALLQAMEENLSQASDKDRDRILANIAGIKGQKARAIQQYNADAKKTYTIGQFRDWQLPYQIKEK